MLLTNAVRCRRLCYLNEDYDRNVDNLIKQFIERGYNEDFLKTEFRRAKQLDRNVLINSKCDNSESTDEAHVPPIINKRCYPLVTTFNPKLPDVSKVISKHKHILSLNDKIREFVNPDNIFATFRKSKTLGDILVSSRFPPKQSGRDITGCKKCERVRCNLCKNYLVESNSFSSPHVEDTFYHTNLLDCQMSYVVYLIRDKICNRAYVGRTENNLSTRWAGHKSHIKTGFGSCKVAAHLNESATEHQWDKDNIDVSLPPEIEIVIIDRVIPEVWDTPNTLFLKLSKKEIYWQDRLRTMDDFGGLNDREERRMTQKRHSKK